MNKDEMRKFVWSKCLLLTTEKSTQYNKGKRSAYEEMWSELGGDVKPTIQEGESNE